MPHPHGTDDIQFLLSLGFEEAGEWVLANGQPTFRLRKHGSESNILYAFVAQYRVFYIGKTVRNLKKRMYGYQKPGPTQRTNIVNHEKIKKMIELGHSIKIFTFVPKETVLYRGVSVSLAAGLEDILIARLKPPWNRVGV